MNFLRTLFWIAITVVVVVFSIRNWVTVTINLFGDLQADVKLPVLLLICFLIGFVPLYIWHKALRWRDRRRESVIVRPDGPSPAAPYPAPAAAAPIPPSPLAPGIGPAQAD